MKVLARNSRPMIWIVDHTDPSWNRGELSRETALNSMAVLGPALSDPKVTGELRRWLAESRLGSQASRLSDRDVMRVIKTCLEVGELRIIEERVPLQRLAIYKPPEKPVEAQPAPARVARQAPAEPPPPEEETVADAQCLEDAANTGAPLVQQA